jgi:hypothetical protein
MVVDIHPPQPIILRFTYSYNEKEQEGELIEAITVYSYTTTSSDAPPLAPGRRRRRNIILPVRIEWSTTGGVQCSFVWLITRRYIFFSYNTRSAPNSRRSRNKSASSTNNQYSSDRKLVVTFFIQTERNVLCAVIFGRKLGPLPSA